MKQLLVNQHTGPHLTYTPELIAGFIAENRVAKEAPDTDHLAHTLREICENHSPSSGFILLGLDQQDDLVGVMALAGGQAQGEADLCLKAMAVAPQAKEVRRALVNSAFRLIKGKVKLDPRFSAPELSQWKEMRIYREGECLFACKAG